MKPEQKSICSLSNVEEQRLHDIPHGEFATSKASSVGGKIFTSDFTNLEKCQLDTPTSSVMACVKVELGGGAEKKKVKSFQPVSASRSVIIRQYAKSLVNLVAVS